MLFLRTLIGFLNLLVDNYNYDKYHFLFLFCISPPLAKLFVHNLIYTFYCTPERLLETNFLDKTEPKPAT